MEFFKYSKSYDFMKKSPIFVALSLLLMAASIALLLTRGLNYGIDFAGGTVIQVKYDTVAPISQMRTKLKGEKLFDGVTITRFGSDEEVIVRIKTTTQELGSDIGDIARSALTGTGNFEIRRVDIVGPKVGSELREKGIMAMLLAVLGILIYVTFRFEWRFALASVFALIHDVTIALGALSLFAVDINLDILAALLTLLGYSLNDTIIVFDRIREGLRTIKSSVLVDVVNESVTRTLSRTTLTSLTTFFVILTLFAFGGEIIHGFSFTLVVGIIVGTYSSIFVASVVLIYSGFNVSTFRAKEAEKQKLEKEKNDMRAMYEQGTL